MASSSSAPMASQGPAIDGINDEIQFQIAILLSMDDTVRDRAEQEQEVHLEIINLQQQVRDLAGVPYDLPPGLAAPAISQSSQQGSVSSASSFKSLPQTINMVAPPAMMGGYQSQDVVSSSSASTPTSDEFPELQDIRPTPASDAKRKRAYSKLQGNLAPHEENRHKSRRTSPNPFAFDSLASTPAGTSSGEDTSENANNNFLGLGDLQNWQKSALSAAEEKRRQEKADEDYARELQKSFSAGLSNPRPGNPRPSSSVRTAFDQMSGMRSSQPASSSMHLAIKNESSSNYPPSSRATNSRDIESISLLDDGSDSDIEVIPSSAFQDNGRRAPNSMALPSHTKPDPAGRVKSENFIKNEGPRAAMYSNQQVPGSWPSASMHTPLSSVPMFGEAAAGQYVSPNTPYAPASNFVPAAAFVPATTFVPPANFMPGPAVYHGSPPFNGGLFFPQLPNSMDLAYSGIVPQSSDFELNSPFNSSLANPISVDMTGNPFKDNNQFDYEQLYGIPAYPDHPHNPNMMSLTDQRDYIRNDPRKTQEEIQSLLENIQPDVDLSVENREGTPAGLKYPLYEHQKIALTWLKSMETGSNKGGILADDMGLGKTISTLALILARPSADVLRKTNLIVGPVALVRQWATEIRTKVNGSHRLSVHMVHGQTKKLDWGTLRNYDVVLTTYGTLAAEMKRRDKWIKDQTKRFGSHYDAAPMQRMFPLLSPKSLFYRTILDEAQWIKNHRTQSAQACHELSSIYRFCLTGTPMMNNAGELYSLIRFLRIRPYNDLGTFNNDFRCLSKGDSTKKQATNALKKFQAVIKAILLRRTKKTMIDGKPIIELPPKTEEIQHVVFSEDELEYYRALESKTQVIFNKYLKAGTVGKNYSNVLVLLLRLRQCCCHPHLINDFEEAPAVGVASSQEAETMLELARNMKPEVIKRILEVENGAFECPVCYDAVSNPKLFVPCGHDTCSECFAKVMDQAVRQNNANGEDGGSKCVSCRSKIESVTDYASFKKVHLPDQETAAEKGVEDDSGESDSDSDSDSDSEDEKSDGDLRDFIVPDDVSELENEDDANDDDDAIVNVENPAKDPNGKGKEKKVKRRKDRKGKGKEKESKKTHLSLAMLKKNASGSAKARKKYMKQLTKDYIPSAKITKAVELLEQFQDEGHKTIVFSQFVSLLDLLQVPIAQKNWNSERYDGGMSADARNAAIERFTLDPSTKMMLISLKAGNAGLNLVAASRVIILDPFWNPYIEMQAVDRAYRIGQQKSVEVHRILIETTVEDRIIELQEKKRHLVDSALDEGANKTLGRLDVRQLAYLFGVGNGN